MNALERLKQFIDYQGLSMNKFYIETSLPDGAFKGSKSTGTENLRKIFLRYPELNMDWVITGRGEMLFRQNLASEPEEEYKTNYKQKYFETLEKYNSCLEEKEQLKNNKQTA